MSRRAKGRNRFSVATLLATAVLAATALFGSFAIGIGGYAAVVFQVLLIAGVTAFTSRQTVNRTLETID